MKRGCMMGKWTDYPDWSVHWAFSLTVAPVVGVLKVKKVHLHLFAIHAPDGMWGVMIIIPGDGWRCRVSHSCHQSWGGIFLAFLFVEATQELAVGTFILLFSTLFSPISTTSIIEAFHCLGIRFLRSKSIYLDFIGSLWIFYFYPSFEIFLGIGLLQGLSCYPLGEESICLKGLRNFPDFYQGLIDSGFASVHVKQLKSDVG